MDITGQLWKVGSTDKFPVIFGGPVTTATSRSEVKLLAANSELRRSNLSKDSIDSCNPTVKLLAANSELRRSNLSKDSIDSCNPTVEPVRRSSASSPLNKREADLGFEISDAIQAVEDAATRAVLGLMMDYLKEIKSTTVQRIESQEKAQKNSITQMEESVDAMRKWIAGWKLTKDTSERPQNGRVGRPLWAAHTAAVAAQEPQSVPAEVPGAELRTTVPVASTGWQTLQPASVEILPQHRVKPQASQPQESSQPRPHAAELLNERAKEMTKLAEGDKKLAEEDTKLAEEDPSTEDEDMPSETPPKVHTIQRPTLEVSHLPTWLRLSYMPQ